MRSIKTTSGAEIVLDGDILAVLEALYHEVTARKERETIDRDVDAGELTPAAPGQSAYQALEQRDRVELLRKAMAELPPTLREAVVKRDIQELSYQEIADQLGLPEGTVKSRINRGRTELARQVQRIRESDEGVTE